MATTQKIHLSTGEKVLIGALGGLSAVCVKFLGQDYNTLIEHGANLSADQLFAMKIGYGVLTPILVFLGALLAWVSEEPNRLKLLAIGIAAPALITTWSGGTKSSDTAMNLSFNLISPAYAIEQKQEAGPSIFNNPMVRSYEHWWSASLDGVKMFFGYGKEIKHYYVVVGSFKSYQQAKQHAQAVNQRNPRLNAHIGTKTDNNFYPVVLGEPALLSVANPIKEKVNASRIVTDAYLAPADKIKPEFGFAFNN